jgi:hypothetical protein
MPPRKKKIPFNLEKIFKKKKTKAVPYLLEHGSLTEMRALKSWTEKQLDFHWKFYSELSFQRNQNIEKIKRALNESCVSAFEFANWQRAVKYRYSLHPLCTIGSTTFVGGRFNSGKEVNSQLPEFQCLYLTKDKDTALQETLGQDPNKIGKLSPRELALTNSQSETIVSVSGHLDKIFDLRKAANLKKLVAIFKTFKISKELKKLSKEIHTEEPQIIKSEKALLESIQEKNWRDRPVNFDIPSNSQIFGYLIYLAGIDGILYSSKLTGQDCLAVFVKNFEQGESFIALDDEAPHPRVPNKIDAKSWRLCEISFEDLVSDRESLH